MNRKISKYSLRCTVSRRCTFRARTAARASRTGIVSINKPYQRPIGSGKEVKSVEFGAEMNNILVDGISLLRSRHSMTLMRERDWYVA